MTTFDVSSFGIPGDNQIALSNELADHIRSRFKKDRDNRFQIYLIACGIRRKYLDETSGNYTGEFEFWYKASRMQDLFGNLQNFTKYASAGEVVSYVGTSTSNPERYLSQLPLVVGALYEISMILKKSYDLFNVCLHFTPRRKRIDDPKHEWKTSKPALISVNATEQKIRLWRQTWDNPPAPKPKRTDKRTLPLATITCNGELFDFDKKTGDKVGSLNLDQVEAFLTKLRLLFDEHDTLNFKLTDSMDYLTKGYYKRKDEADPAKKILEQRKAKQKYVPS